MSKTCPIFSKCQPGIKMTERACPGAKVLATVHRDGYKNRPAAIIFKEGRCVLRTPSCAKHLSWTPKRVCNSLMCSLFTF